MKSYNETRPARTIEQTIEKGLTTNVGEASALTMPKLRSTMDNLETITHGSVVDWSIWKQRE